MSDRSQRFTMNIDLSGENGENHEVKR